MVRLSTDYDQVLIPKNLLDIIPITIIAEWVKGNSVAKEKNFKEILILLSLLDSILLCQLPCIALLSRNIS
jgi:hypothetical protein